MHLNTAAGSSCLPFQGGDLAEQPDVAETKRKSRDGFPAASGKSLILEFGR